MPVIDLAGLGRLAEAPLVVGGVPVPDFYAPDGYHPATVPQGLLGNAVLEAFAGAYDPRIARFRLTDQQLLDEAGIAHAPGHSYFDVSPYVLLPGYPGFPGLAGILGVRDGGPVQAANAPAAGVALRGTSGLLLTDPGSFLVPANTVARGPLPATCGAPRGTRRRGRGAAPRRWTGCSRSAGWPQPTAAVKGKKWSPVWPAGRTGDVLVVPRRTHRRRHGCTSRRPVMR